MSSYAAEEVVELEERQPNVEATADTKRNKNKFSPFGRKI
jgi:hypothetical protein